MGYTRNLDEAGLYSKEESKAICEASDKARAYLAEQLQSIALFSETDELLIFKKLIESIKPFFDFAIR